jgi:hypothetical protein
MALSPNEGNAMSLLDEVRKFEHTVVGRLKELEPLLREYDQLRALAQRLGISYTPSDQNTPATDRPTRRARSATKRSRPARPATKSRAPRSAKPMVKRASRRRSPSTTAAPAPGRPTTAKATPATAKATPATAKATPATTKPAKPRASRGPGRKTANTRPARRSDDVLRVVDEQPGITMRQIGERLGVDPTGLYPVANQLTGSGRLRKDGPRLFPAEPARSTTAARAGSGGAPANDDTTSRSDAATAAGTQPQTDANAAS